MWPFSKKKQEEPLIIAEVYDKTGGTLLVKGYLFPHEPASSFGHALCDYTLVIKRSPPCSM